MRQHDRWRPHFNRRRGKKPCLAILANMVKPTFRPFDDQYRYAYQGGIFSFGQ